jgi:hypothetical protein
MVASDFFGLTTCPAVPNGCPGSKDTRYMVKAVAVITLAASLDLCLAIGTANAANYLNVDCSPDSHVRTGETGRLVVTEYGTSYSWSNCPVRRLNVDNPIVVQGRSVHFWFRLQGDGDYLKSSKSALPLRAGFYLRSDDHWVYQTALPLGEINRTTASKESLAFNNIFDWRVSAEKWSFDVPGTYLILVEQGDETICAVFEKQTNCGLQISVE